MTSKQIAGPALKHDLINRALSGEYRAVARLITLIENDASEAVPYLRELFQHTGRALTIGITGASGSGKSTLLDALAAHYRREGKRVGIIAVDPTSPFTGGAILGDRIRMQSRSVDSGTFIRSMATRGQMGGLSRAANDVSMVMDAAGFDLILVETVGVGQDEVEIVRTAQVILVLLVPGMGDDIQAMKAGIMEIGDVFVINKADHPGVDRVEAELRALLTIGTRPDGWTPAVLRAVALEGIGIAECVLAIDEYTRFQKNSAFRMHRSVQIQKDRLLETLRSRILQDVLETPGAAGRIEEMARRIAERKLDPFSAAEELLKSVSAAKVNRQEWALYRKIDHIGIAVKSLEQVLRIYETGFGLKAQTIEEVSGQGTRVAQIAVGEDQVELLEAMVENSPVARFIAKRGEGLHHICLQVDDIVAALAKLKAAEVQLIDEAPRPGARGCLVAFVHPSSTAGVLVELSQPMPGATNTTSE